MEKTLVRKSKWFWPWQDAQEEAWLEQMSRQGLHLNQVNIPVQYDFVRGQPQNYIYRLDFQDTLKQKNKETYLGLFAEAGWEHIGQMGGWQYFRRLSKPGEENEIFTDSETKIQKYKRFLTWFAVSYPIYFAIFMAVLSDRPAWVMWLVIGFVLSLSTLWAVITLKVWQRINQLKTL